MRAAAVTLALACAALGCRHDRGPGRRYALGHVVVFWLKTPGDAEARQRIVRASEGFRTIPGVLGVRAGEMVPSPRPNVDRSYDVAVVITLRDLAALEQYQAHPRHRAMLKELGPLIDHAVVYDFARPRVRE
jgi:hypothetical protein